MLRKRILFLLPAVLFTLMLTSSVGSAQSCTFTVSGTTMTLNGDCTTTASIIVPDGFTLNGAGHRITATDPFGGHFTGGVVQSDGATANVMNVTITASGLADVCDAGPARLRGILFDGTSGSITNNVVSNINQNQGSVLSGCQEGNAIEVRNFGSSPTTIHVRIENNTITGYQKTGIVANGNSDAAITDNVVVGDGPQGFIAQNGIQLGFGATGMVKRNTVSGNSYTGSSVVSCGVLIFSDQSSGDLLCVGAQVMQNTISGNDVGVLAEQFGEDGFSAPASVTNVKIVNNKISKTGVSNGFVYQAGVSDFGNNDKITANTISGSGYDPATLPGSTFAVDATGSNRPKVHANK